MRYVRYFVWFLVIIFGVSFTLLNSRTVEIDYYFGPAKINVYLPVLILISMLLGALLAYITILPTWLKQKNQIRKLRREIQYPEKG